MKFLILVIFLLSLVFAIKNYTDEELKNEWENWMMRMHKIYKDNNEEMHRFEIWKKNLKTIQEHNEQNYTYTYGLNKFSDLTFDEFNQRMHLKSNKLGQLDSFPCGWIPLNISINQSIPSINWLSKGVVTSIKDQGYCGSCWAFSAIASIESSWAIKYGQSLDLSEQQLVDCTYDDNGCNGGLIDDAFVYATAGLCTDSDYSYTGHYENCTDRQCSHAVKLNRCYDIPTTENYTAEKMMQIILMQQPVSTAINANNIWMHYNGGVIDDKSCNDNDINHAVAVVGYDTTKDGQDYWLIKNSWGTSWGINGYGMIARGKYMCAISSYASFPLV